MKRRELIRSIVITALAGSACLFGNLASAATPAETATEPLAVGQSVRYDGNLKLTFVSVPNDSRCPMGALCIRPGDAEVVLLAYLGDKPAKTVGIHTNDKPRVVTLSTAHGMGFGKSYSVRLKSLMPFRRIGKTIKQSEYRVVLNIQVVS